MSKRDIRCAANAVICDQYAKTLLPLIIYIIILALFYYILNNFSVICFVAMHSNEIYEFCGSISTYVQYKFHEKAAVITFMVRVEYLYFFQMCIVRKIFNIS